MSSLLVRLTLLHATPTGYNGGYEKFCDGLEAYAQNLGWDVRQVRTGALLSRGAYRIARGKWAAPGSSLAVTSMQNAASLWSARKLIGKSDVVYAKNDLLDLAVLRMVAGRTPSVIGFHTSVNVTMFGRLPRLRSYLYRSRAYKRLLAGANGYHLLRKQGSGGLLLRGVIDEIPNGLPAAFDLSPAPPLDPEGPVRFLFVGRLTRQKGIDLLVLAAQRLKSQFGTRVHIRVAGFGEEVAKIAGCPDIEFLGERHDVMSLMQECHWLVIPSRWDEHPLVLLETLSVGRPYVLGSAEAIQWASLGTDYSMSADTSDEMLRVMERAFEVTERRNCEEYRRVMERVAALRSVVGNQEEAYGRLLGLLKSASLERDYTKDD